jgi:hypothetical protein
MKHLEHRMLFGVLAILAFALIATQLLAVTIPTGTTLVVRTLDTISSQDRAGKKFTAQLDQDVVVNGTVLLRAGTKVFGKVESSRALSGPQSRPLTLNLIAISSHGREVPVVTAQAFQAESTAPTGPRGRVTISGSKFVFPHGSKMQFRLAQPLNL